MAARGFVSVCCAFLAAFAAVGVAFGQGCTGTNPVTCTSGSVTVSFPSQANDGTTVKGSPYPSQVNVTATGVVTAITVKINGLTYDEVDNAPDGEPARGFSDLAILLVAPDGKHNLNLLSFPDEDNPGINLTKATNTSLTLEDAASSFLPCDAGYTAPPLTYKPTSLAQGGASPQYGLSGLTINFSGATIDGGCGETALGTSTLQSAFVTTGTQANGTWSLYVIDNSAEDVVSFSSWSLTITTAQAAGTSTTLTSSANPSITGIGVTLTATVTNTSGSGGTPTGSVAFLNGTSAITCTSGTQTLNSSGVATCGVTFNSEGIQSLTATYSPSGNFAASSGMLQQYVRRTSTLSNGLYCNAGPISAGGALNGSGTDSQPYPSVINVGTDTTGITNAVSTVQVTLNGFAASSLEDVQMLLVSPDRNHALDFFDDIGGGAGSPTAGFTVADNGSSGRLPEGSGSITNGATYEPTSYANASSSFPPTFPAIPSLPSALSFLQVPASFSLAGPGGGSPGATFLSSFNNATANGNWTLYVFDNSTSTISVTGGWCLKITPGTGTPTTTTVSGSPNGADPNGASAGSPVTVTAAVLNANTHSAVNTGSVLFTENGLPVAGGPTSAVAVGTSGPTQGVASFTTSSLTEGDHTITATYTDSSNTFSESFGTYVQRVDKATGAPTVNGSVITYCNTGKITIPAGAPPLDFGAATPNPSNIFVSNLFGTIKSVTVSLNGFTYNDPGLLRSLLVGPSATNADSFDFFSDTGGATAVSGLNLTFADSGTSLVGSSLVSGTFKPTSDNGHDTYTASSSGFYTLPAGPYQYAATAGAATFATIFGSANPDGVWSLYFNQAAADTGGSFGGGWCLNFTENAPTLSLAKSHSGNFEQGQQGAQFSLVVTNHGPGPAGGVSPVTVTDTLPTGLTPASTPGSGTDWNCSSSGQTITCTNADVVSSGGTFAALTLNVNVAANAASQLSNTAAVFGSGNPSPGVNSNTDSITVVSAPVLSVSKAHTGTFTQGQTATWTIAVTNSGPAGSTTNGTTTVVDALPSGYTLASLSAPGWSCSGAATITCMSTSAVAAGQSFGTVTLVVNVPANSPKSVTNTADAFGGGDLTHTSLATAAAGSDTVTVNQVPATISATSGTPQTVAEGAAFNSLQATVLDAGNQPISGVSVTFTAPATGASVVFAGTNSNTAAAVTNASGVATSPIPTANNSAGAYTVLANVTPALATPASFSLTNTAVAGPTVVSYNVLFGNEAFNVTTSARNRLPWEITGIQVVFSSNVTGSSASLGGVTVTGFSGSGTNTLTWTISPIAEGSFATTLSGSGANAIMDTNNHALGNGAGAAQVLRVLWGDFNDDGVVNSQDLVGVNDARAAAYNIFADMNGDGVVNTVDVNLVRSRQGTTLP